jgi:membrane fusion protein (multidrug efflux system)
VTAAQANAVRAEQDQRRYAALFQQNAVSRQSVETATAAATAARAQVESARQQVEQAQATVVQRQADVRAAQEQVDAANAAVAQARAQLASAQSEVGASQATVAQTQAQRTAAEQNVAQARAKRTQAVGQLSEAQTSPRQVTVSRASQQTAEAKVLQARAALDAALINLKRTRLYAPVAGVVSRKSVQVGQQVAVGQSLMTVVPTNDIWVVANFKETQLRTIRPGERVEVEVDTFPGHPFRGRVQSIAAGTGATFSLLPPENATGNFTKVVQRVPVKVVFDPDQPYQDRLRAGLSANVVIDTASGG